MTALVAEVWDCIVLKHILQPFDSALNEILRLKQSAAWMLTLRAVRCCPSMLIWTTTTREVQLSSVHLCAFDRGTTWKINAQYQHVSKTSIETNHVTNLLQFSEVGPTCANKHLVRPSWTCRHWTIMLAKRAWTPCSDAIRSFALFHWT